MSIGAIESPETNTLTPTPKSEYQIPRQLTVVEDAVPMDSLSVDSTDYAAIKAELDRASISTKLGGLALLKVVLVTLKEIPPAPDQIPADPTLHPEKDVQVPSEASKTYQQKAAEKYARDRREQARAAEYAVATEQFAAQEEAFKGYAKAAELYTSEDPTEGYFINKPATGWGPDLKKIGELYTATEFAESTVVISALTSMLNDDEGRFKAHRTALIEADRIARIAVHQEYQQDAQDIFSQLPGSKANGVTVLVAVLENLQQIPEDPVQRRAVMSAINQANGEIAESFTGTEAETSKILSAEELTIARSTKDPILRKLKGLQQVATLTDDQKLTLAKAELTYCLTLADKS